MSVNNSLVCFGLYRYGSEAQKGSLQEIASSSGGKEYDGDPKKIESVYRSISSFF